MTYNDIKLFREKLKPGMIVPFETLEITYTETDKPVYKYLIKKGKVLRLFNFLCELEYKKLVILPSGRAAYVTKVTTARYADMIIAERRVANDI